MSNAFLTDWAMYFGALCFGWVVYRAMHWIFGERTTATVEYRPVIRREMPANSRPVEYRPVRMPSYGRDEIDSLAAEMDAIHASVEQLDREERAARLQYQLAIERNWRS